MLVHPKAGGLGLNLTAASFEEKIDAMLRDQRELFARHEDSAEGPSRPRPVSRRRPPPSP